VLLVLQPGSCEDDKIENGSKNGTYSCDLKQVTGACIQSLRRASARGHVLHLGAQT